MSFGQAVINAEERLNKKIEKLEAQAKVANGVWRERIEKLESRLDLLDKDITNNANDISVVKKHIDFPHPLHQPVDIERYYIDNPVVDHRYGPGGP